MTDDAILPGDRVQFACSTWTGAVTKSALRSFGGEKIACATVDWDETPAPDALLGWIPVTMLVLLKPEDEARMATDLGRLADTLKTWLCAELDYYPTNEVLDDIAQRLLDHITTDGKLPSVHSELQKAYDYQGWLREGGTA
jgi:hypothetical protein